MTAQTESPSSTSIPLISDREELLRRGVCKVPIPPKIHKERKRWASELSQITPMNMAGEGDGEYAFYRNIIMEPELEFPLDCILESEIDKAILKYFGVSKLDDIRLDDCFCVHYNPSQSDSSGAKHTDPSDITVNMCIEKTDDVEGSHVLFYGTRKLRNVERDDAEEKSEDADSLFYVCQEEGYATIHFGAHPHETMPLEGDRGRRTNIVLTYWYKDESKSEAGRRTCYFG